MSFKGKTTIITGANKNLGHDTAIAFAKQGSDLLLHCHGSKGRDELKELCGQLEREHGIKTSIFQGDLTQEQEVIELFKAAEKIFGKVDYAINNVGMVLRKPLAECTLEEYNTMFDVNTKSAFLFLREAANELAVGGAVVMLTTSLLAAYTDGYSLYQASKSAVEFMCKALSKETKKKISFNCVSPGPMDTPFLYGQETSERIEFFKTQSSAGRLTKVDDIVPFIKFLVKDGHWMTGQNLFASNGFTAR
ncbi:DEKNAAC104794 [Brettanomyces naardenensis]|uniref:DEKNAAC104794 n=1 Tax=Brettanomyces naardenensis TaxID=13370 RepID=A0A448YS88_BRENA|nr:DEKNAAC104794 [Brettanomyces naardenensis]